MFIEIFVCTSQCFSNFRLKSPELNLKIRYLKGSYDAILKIIMLSIWL